MALTKPVKKVAKPAAPDTGARPSLWTVAEVAAYLNVDPHTVYRKVQYEIRPVRIGRALRFDPIDVYVYAERLKEELA